MKRALPPFTLTLFWSLFALAQQTCLLASFAAAQTTYNVTSYVGVTNCQITSTYPCWGALDDASGATVGSFVFYVKANGDGSFSNMTVMRYGNPSVGGPLLWTANNWTGTYFVNSNGDTVYSGHLSTTALDGTSVSADLEGITVHTVPRHCSRYCTPAKRYVIAGTFTEVIQ